MQRDKDGIEVDQGIFFAHMLAHPDTGTHFCHAMLLPRAEALARLDEFTAHGAIDLGTAAVMRQGKAATVLMHNPRYLNAEDEATLQQTEICVDLAILDPKSELCVLRGDVVDNPKYAGKRVFSTGINLTHLYNGKISYLWYVTREMGFVNKMMRGLARPDVSPDEIYGGTIEKPWIAGVEHFAIGGGCQYLLTMDYVVAASDAYMTLPARKEGIIPGAANMRHVALHRRPHRAPGDHVGPAARLRHAGGPHDLRRDRAAGRDGCGARSRDRELYGFRRRQRGGQPPRVPRRARSRSTCSAATWRSTRASRPTATSRRR